MIAGLPVGCAAPNARSACRLAASLLELPSIEIMSRLIMIFCRAYFVSPLVPIAMVSLESFWVRRCLSRVVQCPEARYPNIAIFSAGV